MNIPTDKDILAAAHDAKDRAEAYMASLRVVAVAPKRVIVAPKILTPPSPPTVLAVVPKVVSPTTPVSPAFLGFRVKFQITYGTVPTLIQEFPPTAVLGDVLTYLAEALGHPTENTSVRDVSARRTLDGYSTPLGALGLGPSAVLAVTLNPVPPPPPPPKTIRGRVGTVMSYFNPWAYGGGGAAAPAPAAAAASPVVAPTPSRAFGDRANIASLHGASGGETPPGNNEDPKPKKPETFYGGTSTEYQKK